MSRVIEKFKAQRKTEKASERKHREAAEGMKNETLSHEFIMNGLKLKAAKKGTDQRSKAEAAELTSRRKCLADEIRKRVHSDRMSRDDLKK